MGRVCAPAVGIRVDQSHTAQMSSSTLRSDTIPRRQGPAPACGLLTPGSAAHLYGRAPAEHARRVICKDADVLPVALPKAVAPWPVCEEQVRVLLASLGGREAGQQSESASASTAAWPGSTSGLAASAIWQHQ